VEIVLKSFALLIVLERRKHALD